VAGRHGKTAAWTFGLRWHAWGVRFTTNREKRITMRPMFDAHLDLAWCALGWNRDLTLPLEELRRSEVNMTDHPARGHGTLTLPELRRAGIGICLSTVLSRSKPEAIPADGGDRRSLDS